MCFICFIFNSQQSQLVLIALILQLTAVMRKLWIRLYTGVFNYLKKAYLMRKATGATFSFCSNEMVKMEGGLKECHVADEGPLPDLLGSLHSVAGRIPDLRRRPGVDFVVKL